MARPQSIGSGHQEEVGKPTVHVQSMADLCRLIHIGGTEAMGFEELAECSKKLQPIEQKVETYTEKNRFVQSGAPG